VSKVLFIYWDALYGRKMSGAKYPFTPGKDGKLLKDLRAIYSDTEIEAFMAAFFTMDDPFFRETGYSLGCFRSCLPKIIRHCHEKLAKAKAAPLEDVVHWAQRMGYCRHKPTCAEPGGAACVALWKMEKREQEQAS